MLPYFILGIALLTGLLLVGRWFVSADPKTLARVLKWVVLVLILGVVLFLAVSGRLVWAVMALPALLPWVMRFRALSRAAKNFSRMTQGGSGGSGASGVETRYLRMSLDHASGAMDGEVIEGPHTGRLLSGMALGELIDLYNTCRNQDAQSAQVLEAFLDRTHAEWREDVAAFDGAGGGSDFTRTSMSRDEAYQILGLESGADEAEIKAAHHRLMVGLHPDRGGSTFLAAKINEAKDVLLGS